LWLRLPISATAELLLLYNSSFYIIQFSIFAKILVLFVFSTTIEFC